MKIALLTQAVTGLKTNYPHDYQGRDAVDNVIAVKGALANLGHEVALVAMNKDAYGKLRSASPDIAFNLCDEGFGNDASLEPHVPAMLDILNIVYTGADFFTLALCRNKSLTKTLLSFHKIPTPPFQVFTSPREELNRELRFPLIVKPLYEDASIGIRDKSVVHEEEALRKRVDYVLGHYRQPALVEEFIAGREINVGILGEGNLEILPLSEIDFSGFPEDKEKICSYEAKWMPKSESYQKSPPACPASLSVSLEKTLKELAVLAYKITRCRDYGRCDFRLDSKGRPYLLEVNPNPDISTDSGLARMAGVAGFGYEELIGKIVDFACLRGRQARRRKEARERILCPVGSA